MEDNGYPEGRAVKLESAIPTTDSEITDVLKRSIALETDKRTEEGINKLRDFYASKFKKKVVRTSWKTEYESMKQKAELYKIAAFIGFIGWGLFIASVLLKIFS